MKISKRVREEAALLLSMWASSDGSAPMFVAAEILGIDAFSNTHRLADAAYSHAATGHPYPTKDGSRFEWRERFAEAEALLRTGWTPE